MSTPRIAVRDCPHANLAPWGGCDDCGGSSADVAVRRAETAYQARIDAMTPEEHAEAARLAEAERAAQQNRPLFPWRARNH